MNTALFETEQISSFDNHRLVTFVSDNKTGLHGYIAIHRANDKIPAFGATRVWNYSSEKDALIDAIRLAKTMSHKAALAGLHCGGAKAALFADTSKIKDRNEFFKAYAREVNFLSGHFVTGSDVGVSREDVILMRRYSRHIVGVMVDPVRYTGLGIFLALQACLKETFGSEELKQRSFAIQGVGKVGQELLKFLYPHTHDIFITDINEKTLLDVKEKFPEVMVIKPEDIHKQKVDVFSPCALSNCLNNKSIKELQCSIICGGANCQLESEEIAEELYRANILYAPDYLVNAGGLISVYDEYEYKNTRVNRVEERVQVIKKNMKKIIDLSKSKKKNTAEVADTIAREIFDRYE